MLINRVAGNPAAMKGLRMVSYKKRPTSYAWIVGIIIFILAMVITFSDVYGLDRFEYTRPSSSNFNLSKEVAAADGQSLEMIPSSSNCDPYMPASTTLPAIPEPTTLWLLAVGCGALLAAKRK